MRSFEGHWLLVKADDKAADPQTDILKTAPDSAQTGRSLEEIAAGE
jgi:hypothetical protein